MVILKEGRHMKLFKTQDKDEKDISYLNLISQYGLIKPAYRQDLSSKRTVEFAYLPDDNKAVLLGSMDGSYPYWISETDIDDIETNSAIIENVLHKDFSSFTGMEGEIYWKLKDSYRRRILVSDDEVKTPFGHGYAKQQPQYWCRFIAKDIYDHHKRLKEFCKERELDGRYLLFLQIYLEKLETETASDPLKDYENKKILMDLIRSEDYLLASDNRDIRDTYIRIRNLISELHNTYMSIVK